MSNYSMDFSICQHLIFGRRATPPSLCSAGSTVTCGATRLPRSTVGSGRGLHEMNPCLFQSPAGAAWTFERIAPPQCSPHCIPRHLALSARGASSVWSYRLSWVPPAQGFASPQLAPLVSPVPRFPFGVSADQTLGHSGSDPSPPSWGTAARHSSVAAPRRLVYRPSAPSRLARVVIGFP